MADDVTLPGTGSTVATDEVDLGSGAAHVQMMKLVDGTDGGTTRVPASSRGLLVDPKRDVVTEAVQSSGLTTATTAYVDGDQLGSIVTFSSMARSAGGTGTITGAVLTDAADVIGAVDLFIFPETVTLAADNAAGPGTSDADTRKCLGVIQLPPAIDVGGARVASIGGLAVPYLCTATSLFVAMVTRSGHTFFSAATDLELRLFVERN